MRKDARVTTMDGIVVSDRLRTRPTINDVFKLPPLSCLQGAPCMGRKTRCLDRINLELTMSTVANSAPIRYLGRVILFFGRLCPCFETNSNYSNFITAELACDDDG